MLRYFGTALLFEKLFVHTFSVQLVSQKLYFRSSYFFRAVAFFEELHFWNSHFFPPLFFQNIYFFRANLLPKNQTLRVENSLVQLPFKTATHRRHLQKSYFFEADSSAQHQLFQRLWKKLLFQKRKIRIIYFFWRATFVLHFS